MKITYGPGETETIAYDAWGRVASRTRGERKAEYRYDHWGRLVEKSEAGVTVSYTFNAYGQRLSRIVKDTAGVSAETRQYDALGRLTEIAEGGRSVRFQYDAQGRVVGQSLNGLPVTLAYTKLGLLDTKTWGDAASPFATLKYFYDSDGSIVGREVNGRRQSYVQDSRGQLLAVMDADGKPLEEYRYVPAGNILSKTVNGKTTVFTYDAANQLVSSECDGKVTRYVYDAAGRMVREGSRGYRYGWLDKVTAISEDSRPYAAYGYHVDGQLASVKYAGRREEFLWDGLALVRRNNNAYINEPHPGGGAPVVSSADGVLLNDMLGTTLGTADGTNARMTGITAFGETSDNAALFTGKPMVDGLGYAFLFRNYQPQNGKWLTADPIGFPDGWNNLAYCNNRIATSFDFLGTYEIDWIGDWSQEEKEKLNTSLSNVASRINELCYEINEQARHLDIIKYRNDVYFSKAELLRQRCLSLISNLRTTYSNIMSSTYGLNVKKCDLGEEVNSRYITYLLFFDDVLEINTSWFTDEIRNDQTIMHEVMHTWTDDGEAEDDFCNSHFLEWLYESSFFRWPSYQIEYRSIWE